MQSRQIWFFYREEYNMQYNTRFFLLDAAFEQKCIFENFL